MELGMKTLRPKAQKHESTKARKNEVFTLYPFCDLVVFFNHKGHEVSQSNTK
jgi:hypothetical protein